MSDSHHIALGISWRVIWSDSEIDPLSDLLHGIAVFIKFVSDISLVVRPSNLFSLFVVPSRDDDDSHITQLCAKPLGRLLQVESSR